MNIVEESVVHENNVKPIGFQLLRSQSFYFYH